ncbi:DUF2752 domain-containing protein [uncultured Traorella sp.]|uniref:DUF2752 domain-containing protein n=1 Tax=uncultured Traorella sp. TaxID=1929048 RepID=UPI0025D8C385|nr:DUF2752 domain-containing protein [uncultured Traorella sp.]
MNKKPFILGCIVLTLFLYVTHARCFVYAIFHIPCPTCGMTRAWQSVLTGHISSAFTYPPLFFLGPVIIFLLLFDCKNSRIRDFLLGVISFLFFIVYLGRLIH